MSLVVDRFDRRWNDLVELGRSMLPGIAPEHTDHNAHDPGITLMELLAAIAEAQIRAATRVRTDEREAYAVLMDVRPAGTRAAAGVLWPDRRDPASPANTFRDSLVIEPDASVHVVGTMEPAFRPVSKLLWAPGTISRLALRTAGGVVRDLTVLNARGSGFAPLGDHAGPGDTLVISFRTAGGRGLVPEDRGRAQGALWAFGVRSDHRTPPDVPGVKVGGCTEHALLSATLVTGDATHDVPVRADTTLGLMRTGYFLLDLTGIESLPAAFDIEIRAPRGLARPPRVVAIEPNVVPVTQRVPIVDELHEGTGAPDFTFKLENAGLCFSEGEEPLAIAVREGGERKAWSRCESLSTQGPNYLGFELNEVTGVVRLGNGVNGARLAAKAKLLASYAVSDGAEGNVAANRRWSVQGIEGVFGINPEAVAGGDGRKDGTDIRRDARRKLDIDHPLVSVSDIEAAAKELPLLEVARAWVPRASETETRAGIVRLVVMRADGESPRWLAAVRAALAPRLALGMRLSVRAPRYFDFTVRARVTVARGHDPAAVKARIDEALAERMRLASSRPSDDVRPAGVSVSARDVTSWIRAVECVADVPELELRVGRTSGDVVKVGADGLPRLDLGASEIVPLRAGAGA